MNKISNDFLKKPEINHQHGQVIAVDSFMIKQESLFFIDDEYLT